MNLFNVAIIGAGPAGIAAALQLNRMGITALLFEKNQPGGLLLNANLVENYPGLKHPLSGPQLAEIFKDQLAKTDTKVIPARVLALDYSENAFSIKTRDNMYRAHTALIASGTTARKIPELKISTGANSKMLSEIFPILHCSDQDIVIIGAGDAAFDYALNMARKNRVEILNRTAQRKCLSLLFKRALSNDNISYSDNTRVIRATLTPENKLMLEIQMADKINQFECDYLVTAIGREPSLDFVVESMKLQMQELQDKGILCLAGDVKNGHYRQALIAAGEGIRAAMMIAEELQGKLN